VKSLDALMKKHLTPEKRAEIRRKAKETAAAIRLQQLRENRDVTQQELARRLGIKQSTLSKFEGRRNMTIQKMQEYVEALGGELVITVVFKKRKKGEVAILTD
jgi:transcriptional regulator with XRE-family HTH domain